MCEMNSHSASLTAKECWEQCGVSDQTADEDDGLLVTNINHSKDLMRMHTLRADPGVCQTSADWLESSSLQSAGLSLSHILSCCSSSPGTTGESSEVSAEVLRDFEMKLYQMIELYHNRIRWLTEGSRKVFGMVRGSKVAVLVDASDVNCSTDRLIDLQRNLLDLLDKQLRHKTKIHLISFGSEVGSQWDQPRDTSPLRLREVQEWVLQLGPSGGCNLLQAVKMALAQTELDSLLVILGSCPDQPSGLLCDAVEQCLLGREASVHSVGYCCSPAAIETVKRLAEVTRGSYHLFSPSLGVLDDSTDLDLLWAEIKTARHVLSHIHNIRSGHMEDVEILTGMEDISLSEKTSGMNHLNAPLHIQPKVLLPVTSVEWLKTHGLKAQKLGLYQVLAPNAYSSLKEFVPVLGKTVRATVHERAMVPFEWHDGTVKNVHVDLPLLFQYQKQLQSATRELERRVLWLSSTGSRQIWGTVCEPRVQILVDASSMNDRHWLHILHSLRLLLEEHLGSQHSFNVIVFGTEVASWREYPVPVSPKNLQEAWQWLQGRQSAGGRNTLGALRLALEGDPHRAPAVPHGLYLFTSGVPDQDMAAVSAYVSECCSTSEVRLHLCLFTADMDTPSDPLPPRHATRTDTAQVLRQLAHAGKGRFHWISQTGIVESDDVSALIGEMEKAARYWQKCSQLVDSLAQRASIRAPVAGQARAGSAPVGRAQTGGRQEKLPPPRPTILTLTRLSNRDKGPDRGSLQRTITWRPTSAKAVIPPAKPVNGWKPAENDLRRKKIKTSQSCFFLEDGSMGMVFKAYPKARSIRNGITTVKLPKREEICSTKQWLKRYGIRSLRLDLHKLISGPDCVHHKRLVPDSQQKGSAKYCAILPSVELNGRVRHLQLTPTELSQYLTEARRLLQRYCHRMQWLLSGSRRAFGTVLESSVCFLLDVSGSMAPNLSELKRELASLIWEQLHGQRVRFTLLVFSGDVRSWRPELVEPTEEACRQAVQWLSQLTCHGGTHTLEALQAACGLGAPLAWYLISDGRPDSSCSLVLREAERLTAGKDITIHTIAFHCRDRADKEFLKKLAHKTGGRFHCAQEDGKAVDALASREQWESKLNDGQERTVLLFEGDDLRRLGEEMNKLVQFQREAGGFRDVLLEKKDHE
ncbi:von Willebrand factor A domain-containing protein 3A [Clupea harengus]|uniref:von Willebrand factor A domain-containing protein 3A n=1 Tax=Clupea harengus TaxID=7950 RepID=A0A8M1KRI4_CLUHA|nr:von Willebrand factor A domain-containing protein 3A [Clupea harengus]